MAKCFSEGIEKSIGHLAPKVNAYADDIPVFAESFEECLDLLD